MTTLVPSASMRLIFNQKKVKVAALSTIVRTHHDNGSKNFGRTHEYLKDQSITQYFAKPKTLKDESRAENLINKLQQKYLDEHRTATNLDQLRTPIHR